MDLSNLARVQRGADWLDEFKPNWRDAVDIEEFDMEHPDSCIIGQTFRNALNFNMWGEGRSAWSLGTAQLLDTISFGEIDADEEAQEFSAEQLYGFERIFPEDYEDLAQIWLFHIARQPVPEELRDTV